jgi:hypothetical protein
MAAHCIAELGSENPIPGMPEGPVRTMWLKSVKAELKTLFDAYTFILDSIREDETSTPVMEIFKVKINSDGTLDKLKTQIVVRGDLQGKSTMEDKWSPTASFRSLKMFLAHASRLKVRVKQLDFVGAFLQAPMRSRMFVTIPKIFGILSPEYAAFCGVPVRLQKSMYGTTLSGKYWYLELMEYLLELGFKPSSNVPCLIVKVADNGKEIYVLNYVDDMLYYGTCEKPVKAFEESLQQRFNLELMGQAHWYLATRISQLSNYDVELDQSRYCLSLIKKYLDAAGCKKVVHHHNTPLPLGFIPTLDDCSLDEVAAEHLSVEYNVNYASCIGSLIYLTMTRMDITHAVNKLAKFSHRTGKSHFEALFHVLRYLRDNCYLGIKFYSNLEEAPLIKMLRSQNIKQHYPFFGFSDSSWNDDVDSGRSTGCFIIAYIWEVSWTTALIYLTLSPCHLQRQNTMKGVAHLWWLVT